VRPQLLNVTIFSSINVRYIEFTFSQNMTDYFDPNEVSIFAATTSNGTTVAYKTLTDGIFQTTVGDTTVLSSYLSSDDAAAIERVVNITRYNSTFKAYIFVSTGFAINTDNIQCVAIAKSSALAVFNITIGISFISQPVHKFVCIVCAYFPFF
jgi:hypothetical protein